MGSPIRAVFLDAGHTLIHPVASVGEIYARAARGFGAEVEAPELDRALAGIWGEHAAAVSSAPDGCATSDALDRAMWEGFCRALVARVPSLRVPFEPWFDGLYATFARPDVWQVYPDVLPALAAFRAAGLAVGIVSNWDSRLEGILAGLGLGGRVDFVVYSSRAGWRKPDPRIFRIALARARVDAAEALHVGDSEAEDARGAAAAGVRCLLLDRSGARDGDPRSIRSLPEAAKRLRAGAIP